MINSVVDPAQEGEGQDFFHSEMSMLQSDMEWANWEYMSLRYEACYESPEAFGILGLKYAFANILETRLFLSHYWHLV